jgi:1-aminocyclopropane-1-carboxylate deaminase/D-cysteine desulfhydrase-like pyridoxal-dependent ACC family enzyme
MGSAASSTIRQRLIGIAVAKGEQDRDVEFASHAIEQLPEARVSDLSVARSQHVVSCDYEEIGFGCVSPQMLEGIQCLGVAVKSQRCCQMELATAPSVVQAAQVSIRLRG